MFDITLLCGPYLDPLVDRYAAFVALNAALGCLLPARIAADWMFLLVADKEGKAA